MYDNVKKKKLRQQQNLKKKKRPYHLINIHRLIYF